jgi:hypothetical protein
VGALDDQLTLELIERAAVTRPSASPYLEAARASASNWATSRCAARIAVLPSRFFS